MARLANLEPDAALEQLRRQRTQPSKTARALSLLPVMLAVTVCWLTMVATAFSDHQRNEVTIVNEMNESVLVFVRDKSGEPDAMFDLGPLEYKVVRPFGNGDVDVGVVRFDRSQQVAARMHSLKEAMQFVRRLAFSKGNSTVVDLSKHSELFTRVEIRGNSTLIKRG